MQLIQLIYLYTHCSVPKMLGEEKTLISIQSTYTHVTRQQSTCSLAMRMHASILALASRLGGLGLTHPYGSSSTLGALDRLAGRVGPSPGLACKRHPRHVDDEDAPGTHARERLPMPLAEAHPGLCKGRAGGGEGLGGCVQFHALPEPPVAAPPPPH